VHSSPGAQSEPVLHLADTHVPAVFPHMQISFAAHCESSVQAATHVHAISPDVLQIIPSGQVPQQGFVSG
jgi:hypothetical protein